jgi:hypothetical protein
VKKMHQTGKLTVGVTACAAVGLVAVASLTVHHAPSVPSSGLVGTTKMTKAVVASKHSAIVAQPVSHNSVLAPAPATSTATSTSVAPSTQVNAQPAPQAVSSTQAATPGGTTSSQAVLPEITGLSLSGETALGQTGATVQYIWIYGSGFGGATDVTFGSDVVPIYARSGSTALEVAAPLQSVGTVAVRVLAGTSASPLVSADEFSYVLAPLQ